MGQEIVYCSDCGRSLRERDFEAGKAHRIENRPYCSECRKPATAPAVEPVPETSRITRRSGTFARTVRPAGKPPNRKPLLFGAIGGGGLLLILIIVAAASGGGTVDRAVAPPPVSAPVSDPVVLEEKREADQREAKAGEALRKARAFVVSTPEDLDQKVVLYRQANFLARGTSHERDARRELEEVERKGRRALDSTFENVKSQVRTAVSKENFGGAVALLEEARKDPVLADRIADLDEQIRGVEAAEITAFTAVRDAAMEARRKGDEAEVAKLRARVARWGTKGAVEEFDGWLGTIQPVKPPPPPPSPAERAWRTGMRAASGRRYAVAIERFEASGRPEAKALIAAIGKVQGVVARAREVLSAWPSGKELSVRYVNPLGGVSIAGGPVLRAGPTQVVVRSGGKPVFIELGELTAASLAEVYRSAGGEPSAAAGLCLFEGDVAGARTHVASVAPALEAYAREAAALKPLPEEAEARTAFYRAVQASIDPVRTEEVARRVEELLARYGETSFAARNRESIAALARGPKEFLWAVDDLQSSGAFERVEGERVSPCLRSSADAAAAVELSFAVRAGMKLMAWAYVGGCCRETMTLSVEGTEVEERTVAPSLLTLKRTHAQHRGDKRPSSWSWVKLPVPGWYSAGGVKRLRLGSTHKGVAVGYVLLSSERKTAPRGEALETLAALHRSPVRFNPADHPDLVAWWPFDEGEGTSVRDATGHGHDGAIVGSLEWVAGKRGGALRFDGKGAHVRVPNHADLMPQALTLAAWVRLPGKPLPVGIVTSIGENQGYRYRLTQDGRLEAFDRGVRNALMSTSKVALGTWTHLAWTADGKGMRLYIDGLLAGSTTRPFGGAKVAHALYVGATPEFREWFAGTIDEVLLFRRALSEEEVVALRAYALDGVPEMNVANLKVKSGEAYEWFRLSKGARVYVDRDFVVESYPAEFEGARVLRAANDDKKSTGDAFVEFDVSEDVTVYVVHDDRLTPKPPWLAAFRKTGGRFAFTRHGGSIYAKDFPAGRVSLGGNVVTPTDSATMYTVMIK